MHVRYIEVGGGALTDVFRVKFAFFLFSFGYLLCVAVSSRRFLSGSSLLFGASILLLFVILWCCDVFGVDLAHIFGKLLHELCACSMHAIEDVLITTSTTARYKFLLFYRHCSFRVLAFLTKQILFNKSIIGRKSRLISAFIIQK